MPKDATTLAAELLAGDADGLEELRVHEFTDDEEAHDDEAIEKLYTDFSNEFDRVEAALSKKYGRPWRTGREDDDAIPLNGVFRFAAWPVGDKQLFAAAAHEDRGVPILLMLGTCGRSMKTHWGVSPVTGLPVILGPTDAPARSMTAEELQAVADATQLEEDLLRAGIVVPPSTASIRRS